MQGYSLTKRGKYIVITAGIVLLLVLPSLILAVWALSRDGTPDGPSYEPNGLIQNGAADTAPATPAPTPPAPTPPAPDPPEPTPEAPPDEAYDPPDEDISVPEHVEPPFTGLVDFDFRAGTMTFLFSPYAQTAIDDNTISMLATFLASPQNTDGSLIAVEIPQLPDDDAVMLTSAIIDALAAHEVPLSDIIFLVYQPEPDALAFEISMSFH